MGPMTSLVGVIVALFCVNSDGAMTDAREESCAEVPVKQQLVQARAILHHQEDEVEKGPYHGVTNGPPPLDSRPAAAPAAAPASAGPVAAPPANNEAEDDQKFFCSSESEFFAKCADGKLSILCEEHGHGPVAECPCAQPYRCAVCESGNCCHSAWRVRYGACGKYVWRKYEPRASPTPEPTPAPPPLQYVAGNPTRQIGRCEGDCDRDSDCEGSFKCFQREHGEAVPGCLGKAAANGGDKTSDYCYDPEGLGWPDVKYIAGNPTEPIGECEADCDNDNDCKEGLICFLRDGYLAIPGCSGEGTKGSDYCIKPAP